jgi:phage terminase small subunit
MQNLVPAPKAENGAELTGKERLFVAEYLIDLNPLHAVRRAGFPNPTRKLGLALLSDPRIAQAVEEGMARRAERLQITQDRVVEEYAKLGFSNIADFVDWNGAAISVRAKASIPRDKIAAIQEIKEQTTPAGTTISVKLYDKKAALDSLARHLGMFNDKLSVHHTHELSQELSEARERALSAHRAIEEARSRQDDAIEGVCEYSVEDEEGGIEPS